MDKKEEQTNDNKADSVTPIARGQPPNLKEIVTENVLYQIITGYNPELSLLSWQAQPGSSIGDHYMSVMYAVELELQDSRKTGETEKLQVMLKTIPRNIVRADMINESRAFDKEALMFQNVLPLFVEIQKERKITETDLFCAWPICYAAHLDGKTDFLAMENLKVSGYKMGSRVSGLDFNHCSIVLRKLAKFHAISYVKYDGKRERIVKDFPILNENLLAKNIKMSQREQNFFSKCMKNHAESAPQIGQELAASRLEKLSKADFSTVLGDLFTQNIEHAVISHGDCWVNNVMFKYRQTDTAATCPIDIKFVDFQGTSATSRLIDVLYFLMTSCKVEVLNAREEDLFMMYYTEFTNFAESLGMDTRDKGLTWENFMKEADKYRLYGVCLGIVLAPMLAADSTDIPELDSCKETLEKFYDDLKIGVATQKVVNLVLKQLPKCCNAEEFL